jgi:hypothetical protein
MARPHGDSHSGTPVINQLDVIEVSKTAWRYNLGTLTATVVSCDTRPSAAILIASRAA